MGGHRVPNLYDLDGSFSCSLGAQHATGLPTRLVENLDRRGNGSGMPVELLTRWDSVCWAYNGATPTQIAEAISASLFFRASTKIV